MILCIVSLIIALTFASPGAAVSASQLILSSPFGDNSFVLQGKDLDGVATMDLTLTYDAAAWTNPRLDQGNLISGALMAVNSNTPGTLRIGVIRTTPIRGSGNIATLSFDARGNGAGKLFKLEARLTALDGNSLPVTVRVINPENQDAGGPDQPAVTDEPQNASPGQYSGGGSLAAPRAAVSPSQIFRPPTEGSGADMLPETVTGATVGTLSGQHGEGSGTIKTDAAPTNQTLSKGRSTEGKDGSPTKAKAEIHARSVLDRFKEYAGDRTPSAFIALFEPDRFRGFSQVPAIVLTDGETPAEVLISSDSGYKKSPAVSVLGGRLISLQEDQENAQARVLEFIPEDMPARLVLPNNNFVVVLPLVHAPKLNIDLDNSGAVTKEDFSLFLRNKETSDLNSDGKRDYLDDYLFTANYLAVNPDEMPDISSKPETPQEQSTFAGPEEKLSYALGMVLGQQFRSSLVEVDPDLYLQGLKDAMAGDAMLLTEKEARLAVDEFQRRLKAKRAVPPSAAGILSDIKVSFMLDPRLTRGMYMGERWVSPPTFTSTLQEGSEIAVDARAQGLDAAGRSLLVNPEWITTDPDLVTVKPGKKGSAKIIVKKAGQTSLKVVSQGVTKELSIKAIDKGNSLQVEIAQ
jgi:hypothetical protein